MTFLEIKLSCFGQETSACSADDVNCHSSPGSRSRRDVTVDGVNTLLWEAEQDFPLAFYFNYGEFSGRYQAYSIIPRQELAVACVTHEASAADSVKIFVVHGKPWKNL